MEWSCSGANDPIASFQDPIQFLTVSVIYPNPNTVPSVSASVSSSAAHAALMMMMVALMKATFVVVLGVLAMVMAASPQPEQLTVNQSWTPCETALGAPLRGLECAEVLAPLCYSGICQTSAGNVTLSVKRVRALAENEAMAPVLWVADDLTATPALRQLLGTLARHDLNVYFLHRRGANGSMPDAPFASAACQRLAKSISDVASGPTLPGPADDASALGVACAKDVNDKYDKGGLAAFSTSAAALDLASAAITLMPTTTSRTFVYGATRGADIVRRLLQVDGFNASGYIIDSLPPPTLSTHDEDVDRIAGLLLDACDRNETSTCHAKFQASSTHAVLKTIYDQIGTSSPLDRCFQLIGARLQDNQANASLSARLPQLLLKIIRHRYDFRLLPAFIHRLKLCRDVDLLAFERFFAQFDQHQDFDHFLSSSDGNTLLLKELLLFSEQWEDVAPTHAQLTQRFSAAAISDGAIFRNWPSYCAFTQDNSSECQHFLQSAVATPMLFEKDALAIASTQDIKLSSSTRVLVLSSRINPFAPATTASAFVSQLNGGQVLHVLSDHVERNELLVYMNDAIYVNDRQVTDLLDVFVSGNLTLLGTLESQDVQQLVQGNGVLAEDKRTQRNATLPAVTFDVAMLLSDRHFSSQDMFGDYESTNTPNAFAPLVISTIVLGAVVFAVLSVVVYRQEISARKHYEQLQCHEARHSGSPEQVPLVPMLGDPPRTN